VLRRDQARVQGQPLNIGIFVDQIEDIGRVEDVHFVPWFSESPPLIYHQTTFGRAFIFGRADWEYVFNTFAYAYAIGYHFVNRPTGCVHACLQCFFGVEEAVLCQLLATANDGCADVSVSPIPHGSSKMVGLVRTQTAVSRW
jgi:hypothetical protein